MFNIGKIFKDNYLTHYDFRNGRKIRRWPYYSTVAVSSFTTSLTMGRASNDFLTGALSAEAILVGFSFNVLFYLVANRRVRPAVFVDIEHQIRFKKLSKLSDEIFSNVSYFNVVAIISTLFCMVGLILVSDMTIPNINYAIDSVGVHFPKGAGILESLEMPLRVAFFAALIFLLIESAAVFLRTVGRVGYYFTSLKVMDTDAEDRI